MASRHVPLRACGKRTTHDPHTWDTGRCRYRCPGCFVPIGDICWGRPASHPLADEAWPHGVAPKAAEGWPGRRLAPADNTQGPTARALAAGVL